MSKFPRPLCPACNREMYSSKKGWMCSSPICKESGKAKPAYADLHTHTEDSRINLIGKTVMEENKTAAVIVDDEPGKPERYINKLKERFPGIVIGKTFKGPVPGVISIEVGPPGTIFE